MAEIQRDIDDGLEFLRRQRKTDGGWGYEGVARSDLHMTLEVAPPTALVDPMLTATVADGLLPSLAVRSHSGLLALPVTHEDLTRPSGVVTILASAHNPVVRLATVTVTPSPLLPWALETYLATDEPYYKLRCEATNQTWDVVYWHTACSLSAASLLLRTLVQHPDLLVRSIVRSTSMAAPLPPGLDSFSQDTVFDADTLTSAILSGAATLSFPDACALVDGISAATDALSLDLHDALRERSTEYLVAKLATSSLTGPSEKLLARPRGESLSRMELSTAVEILVLLSDGRFSVARDSLNSVRDLGSIHHLGPDLWQAADDLIESLRRLQDPDEEYFFLSNLGRAESDLARLRALLPPLLLHGVSRPFVTRITETLSHMRSTHEGKDALLLEWKSASDDARPGHTEIAVRFKRAIVPLQDVRLCSARVSPAAEITILDCDPVGLDEWQVRATAGLAPNIQYDLVLEVECTLRNGHILQQTLLLPWIRAAPGDADVESPWEDDSFRFPTGPPLCDGAAVGRRQLAAGLAERVLNAGQAIAISGSWRLGKSTLLLQLEAEFLRLRPESAHVCRLDFQTAPLRFGDFCRYLVELIAHSVQDSKFVKSAGKIQALMERLRTEWSNVDTLSLGQVVSLNKAAPASQYVVLLKTQRSLHTINAGLIGSEEVLLVTIDELNRLEYMDHAEEVLSLLRWLVQSMDAFRFAIAAFDAFAPLRDASATFFNVFEPVPLPPLCAEEVRELLGQSSVQWSDPSVELIRAESGGSPFWVSALANGCIDLLVERKRARVDESLVREAIPRTLAKWDGHLDQEWVSLSDDQMTSKFLLELAKLGGDATVARLREAMGHPPGPPPILLDAVRKLLRRGAITKSGPRVRLTLPLFGRWLRSWKGGE